MNIDLQSQVAFQDREGFLIFLGDHAFAHDSIAMNISTANTLVFPQGDIGNIEEWIGYHAAEHDSIASALNLSVGYDLRNVDFRDESQFYDWMLNHRLIHDLINTTLGL